MRMRLEVQLPTAPIGYVGIELGRCEVRVAEHLLDGTQVGSSLQEMSREGMSQEMWMDALRLEPCLAGEPPKDEEDARASQPAALGVQEELGAVT
jgi:hypothetical protein